VQQTTEDARPEAAAPADELQAVRLDDAAEAKAWALLFGCSVEELAAAVAEVGGDPAALGAYFERRLAGAA
jgi:hypothetical protein